MKRRIRLLLGVASFGALALVHCKEPTSVQLVVTTNVPFAAGATRVGVYAARSAAVEESALQALQDSWGPDGNVGTITVVPSSDSGDPIFIRVVMGIGRDPEQCRLSSVQKEGCIVARRRVTFVKGEPLVIPVRLHLACNGVLCSADTTCNVVGTCVSAAIDGDKCKTPGGCEVEGDGPGASARDGGMDALLEGGPSVPDATVDGGPVPGDAGADVVLGDSGPDGGISDSGSDTGTDAGTDSGGGGNDGGSTQPGAYSPCTNTAAIDPEAAWPVVGGCAERGNRSRLAGPHALPAVRSISLAGQQPSSRIVAGRVAGNALSVFVATDSGARNVRVPLDLSALALGWSKSPTAGSWHLGLGPDGTLFLASAAATYALDPSNGAELAGWDTTGAGLVADLMPAPGPQRGVLLARAGSGATLSRRNAAAFAWNVGESSATPGNIVVLPNGDVLWPWLKSTNVGIQRLRADDGVPIWGPVNVGMPVPALVQFLAGGDRFFVVSQSGGSPVYVSALSINDGTGLWGPVNSPPSNTSGQTLLIDNSALFSNESAASAIATYAFSNGTRGTPAGLAGLGPGGIVSDKDKWIFLALGNELRAFAPPYTAQAWGVPMGSGCAAPILAAGYVIAMCTETLYVVGP